MLSTLTKSVENKEKFMKHKRFSLRDLCFNLSRFVVVKEVPANSAFEACHRSIYISKIFSAINSAL